MSTYSNSQLVIANTLPGQFPNEKTKFKRRQLQSNNGTAKKGNEVVEDKLANIFNQIRKSAQYNNDQGMVSSATVSSNPFVEYDNRNIHENANLWKMMRKMAGAGALMPPSQSDNN